MKIFGDMKLQLALDILTLDDALALTGKVRDYIDIIEIGTPFLLEEGMNAVRLFREKFPDKEILADTKIMDAGNLEATSAFKAGADYATVLAVTDLATISACVDTANLCNKKIIADMICVSDIPQKIAELESLNVHGVAVHTGVDQQKRGRTPLGDLRIIKRCAKKSQVFVAGGINLKNIHEYAQLQPDVLIIGGGICNAGDPVDEARKIYEATKSF